MSERILIVDDDPIILSTYLRTLRRHFQVETAVGPAEGLAALQSRGPFAVVMSDMYMPGMSGMDFLGKLKEVSPDTVRIIITGRANLEVAIDAVNEGNVFRFLTKPCAPEVLHGALASGIAQYRLVTAEKELLEKTLSGSVVVLTELLSLANLTVHGRSETLRARAREVSKSMNVGRIWEVEVAAMLCHLGMLTLPDAVLRKRGARESLATNEQEMLDRVPEISHQLLSHIPRLEGVAQIVYYHNKRFDGGGFPQDDVAGDRIPQGARILKALIDLGELEEDPEKRPRAMALLEEREGWYDPTVLGVMERMLPALQAAALPGTAPVWTVRVRDLQVGHKLASDLETSDGVLILGAGHTISPALFIRIRNFLSLGGIKEPILIEDTRSSRPEDQQKAPQTGST